MKRLISALVLLLAVTTASAQYAIGSWRQHRAYGNATRQVVADGQVFCLASGNLFVYYPETTEVQTLDTQTGLSGNGISYIDHDATTHTVIVAYADGAIDLIDSRTLDVTGLTSLRDKDLLSKTINGITVDNGTAWLLMSFGLIEVDLHERRFGETYDLKADVCAGAVLGGELFYCIKGDGMYRADLSLNLHDKASHRRVNSHVYNIIISLDKYLYGLAGSELNRFCPGESMTSTRVDNKRFAYITRADGCIMAHDANRITIIDADGTMTTITQPNDFKSIVRKGTTFWASRGLNGLQPYKVQDDALVEDGSAIIPNSPRYDYFYRMSYTGQRLLVAGGAHEYGGSTYEGTASYYDNGIWTNLDTVMIGRERYENITGIAQHPGNPQQHYVTSMGHGVYVYNDGHLAQRYTYDNSPLATILPDDSRPFDYIRVNAPTFDKAGNLWVLNGQVDTLLWCLTPSTGRWQGYYFYEIEGARCPDGVHLDDEGRIWVLIRDMGGRGIFCYDPATGKHLLRSTITQQDGLSYNPDNFFCLTPDRNGHLWIGTEQGLFVISDPDDFFAGNFTWTQIKVNREDGSGLADYLLSGAYVSTIAIDGGNRKWIGTVGSGVYLVSEDGQEMLRHFTTDDSPLPSDNIRSIAVNPVTGEVMIGTEKGLVSYMGDATEPLPSLDEDDIEVFPNPVRPDFDGCVTIRGLVADCEVKVTTAAGQLVWSGQSVGGTATWDLKRRSGGRVATGIYNIILNTSDGKEAIVSRLAVIR